MIRREISWRSPLTAFARLSGEAHAHLLHGGARTAGGWSVIVAFPSDVVVCDALGAENFLGVIDELTTERRVGGERRAPFCSGLVGFIGYEALKTFEPTLELPSTPYALPDAAFGVYDAAAVFSRDTSEAYIVGREEAACRRLERALGVDEAPEPSLPAFAAPTSNFTRTDYEAAIAGIIEEIRDGGFYQANIAQRLIASAERDFSPFDVFRAISSLSDADHGAFLRYDAGAIISNSPERFFRLTPAGGEQRIIVEPIKGTRPRNADPKIDEALAAALLEDPKDRAENIMIADLMRNDLSKICSDGSIREDEICALMSLTHVHHLVSRVSGVVRDNVSIAEILRALFPAGSITGAPKIAAMNAIARTEKIGRGPYCGAIGYVDDSGGADFSVAIRTLVAPAAGNELFIPVGGGVTLRSDPNGEYQETWVKARGALAAISQAAAP